MKVATAALIALALWLGNGAREVNALFVPEQWQPLVTIFFTADEIPTVSRIIECESGWNRFARNPSGTDSGLLQITEPTWEDARYRLEVEVDPHYAAWTQPPQQFAVARALIDERGFQPWSPSRRCWQ